MALTDVEVRAAKPAAKAFKMVDGGGLYLFVPPTGAKLWRYRYEFGGKEKLLSIGQYPEVSLAKARNAREAARDLIRDGRDPAAEKQARKKMGSDHPDSFEAIARSWHTLQRPTWSDTHASDVLISLEQSVFPKLGKSPIREITTPQVLAVLRAIEARPAIETARRVRQRMSAVFVYAISSGLAEADPAAVVKGALAPLVKGRQPAIVDLDGARSVLTAVEDQKAHPVTKLANRLLALTVVRPGELRGAKWEEMEGLDGPEPIWRVPEERMKMKREHVVPLTPQAVEVIRTARTMTGNSPFIFPNARHAHKPMSENAIGYLLNRAGYHSRHVPHGWRATFSTVMNETYPADRSIIDLMLAHISGGKTEVAYNRAKHMPRRRELAQLWADMLLDGAPPALQLIQGPRR